MSDTRPSWEPIGRRLKSKLTVHNQTNMDEGKGASLHLRWERDTRPESIEADIEVGARNTQESKYVQNGDNLRRFQVFISKGDREIGDFLHPVYNPPTPADAGEDNVYIRVDYQRNGVELYKLWYHGDQQSIDSIGTISVEEWES